MRRFRSSWWPFTERIKDGVLRKKVDKQSITYMRLLMNSRIKGPIIVVFLNYSSYTTPCTSSTVVQSNLWRNPLAGDESVPICNMFSDLCKYLFWHLVNTLFLPPDKKNFLNNIFLVVCLYLWSNKKHLQ